MELLFAKLAMVLMHNVFMCNVNYIFKLHDPLNFAFLCIMSRGLLCKLLCKLLQVNNKVKVNIKNVFGCVKYVAGKNVANTLFVSQP